MIFSTGRGFTGKIAGTVSKDWIVEKIYNPCHCSDKSEALWIVNGITDSLNKEGSNYLSREYQYLIADIDGFIEDKKGFRYDAKEAKQKKIDGVDRYFKVSEIIDILSSLEITNFFIYPTINATQITLKVRLIIPLAQSICYDKWHDATYALFKALSADMTLLKNPNQKIIVPCLSESNKDIYKEIVSHSKPNGTVQPNIVDELVKMGGEIFKLDSATTKKEQSNNSNATSTPTSSIVDRFNQLNSDWNRLLESYGYKKVNAFRYLHPNSSQGKSGAGVTILGNKYYSHHANCDALANGRANSQFDVFCEFEHGGNVSSAIKFLGEQSAFADITKENRDNYNATNTTNATNATANVELSIDDINSTLGGSDACYLADNAKAPDYLIYGILEKNSHGILAGTTGSFKSFIALEMAVCIATGKQFLGKDIFKTGTVFYICGEGASAISRRIRGLNIYNDLDRDKLSKVMTYTKLNLRDEEKIQLLIKAIQHYKPILIIYDTLNSLSNGLDNNSSKEVSLFMRNLFDISNQVNASTMIVHHFGKDVSKGMEGSHAFKSNSDFVFTTQRAGNTLSVNINCEKQKDGEQFDEIMLELKEVGLGLFDEKGNESKTLVVTGHSKDGGLRSQLLFQGRVIDEYKNTQTAISREKLKEIAESSGVFVSSRFPEQFVKSGMILKQAKNQYIPNLTGESPSNEFQKKYKK